jgi:hypothetical protein
VTHKSITQLIQDSKSQATEIVAALEEGKHYFMAFDNYSNTAQRKVLKKPGAEIIANALGLIGELSEAQVELTVPGNPGSAHAIVRCTLVDKQGSTVSCGVGAFATASHGMNTAVKMAAKSAFIDAVIRGTSISDCFTQDIEVQPESAPGQVATPKTESNSASPNDPVKSVPAIEPEAKELITWIENNVPFSKDIPWLYDCKDFESLSLDILKKIKLDNLEEEAEPKSIAEVNSGTSAFAMC